MEQRRRQGGNSGLGYYTSWEKSKENGCIYCGNTATTREHIPSKAFLLEPYPDNLPTIPACFDCNNGYSEDEKYVSCFVDLLKRQVYLDYSRREKIDIRLEKDERLRRTLQEQIKEINGKIYFQPDEQRILRILLKLAKCHAGFEFDYINFDNAQVNIWYDFLFNISEDILQDFEVIPEMDTAPEIGSRVAITSFIIQNIITQEVAGIASWIEVQENQYRYQVSLNEGRGITVKIVIFEFLFCKVNFKD